jgi:hypothetical protein
MAGALGPSNKSLTQPNLRSADTFNQFWQPAQVGRVVAIKGHGLPAVSDSQGQIRLWFVSATGAIHGHGVAFASNETLATVGDGRVEESGFQELVH